MGTIYFGMMDGPDTGTESGAQQVIPVTGTISQFYVRTGSDIGGTGDSYAFVLRINGANTILNCTITGGGATELACSDTTDAVAVTAGQLLSIVVTESDSPSSTTVHWTARLVTS